MSDLDGLGLYLFLLRPSPLDFIGWNAIMLRGPFMLVQTETFCLGLGYAWEHAHL